MIVMQNSLFARRQEINKQINQSNNTLVTTRRQAIAMKEILQLNLTKLERAECKVTRFPDQEMVTIIIQNYCDLMREVEFPNTTEKVYFSEWLVSVRRDKENGLDVDLDCFLSQIVDVFKQDDTPNDTLQAALMAVNIPNHDDDYRQDPRARNGSGGVQGNTSHMETAMPSPTEQEPKVIGMVLKALNDLKSDMGTGKKILNISDGAKAADAVHLKHKQGYRASEKREKKKKSRFAGAAAKGTRVPRQSTSSAPQPLTSRVVTIGQSDSDSDQSAQLAGIQQQHKYVVPDYRILTVDHNETVLGEKCLRSFLKSP
jgi:hypothetical protein